MKLSFTLKQVRTFFFLLALLVVSGGIGYRLGSGQSVVSVTPEKKIVINSTIPSGRTVDFALFWDVWKRLEQSYIDKKALDTQKMVWGAISGMVSSLDDPYTLFLPPKENKEFKDDLGGNLEGIGAQLGLKDKRIVVIAPLKGTPAQRAGILPGDYILKVNNTDTVGWTVPEAVTKIRGPKGTKVALTIFHEGATAETELEIMRDAILIPSVEWDIKTASGSAERVAHLRLSRFGDQTNTEWDKAIKEINTAPNLSGVVLDVRNNPGGYLQGAVYIASEFIDSGVVVAQENSDGTQETYSVTRAGKMLKNPLVVLINKGSASAAEILAGALRDHKRAKLVGENSFGKGSVQSPEDLPGGSGLHITTAKWLLPGGEWINGKGIKPEIEVKNDVQDPTRDLQLEKAIEDLVVSR